MRLVLAPSPLLGPASLQPLAAALEALGHEARALRLPSLLEIEGDYYPALAEAMAAAGPGDVLVTHSGGGAVVPLALQAAQGRWAGVVLVDALMPHPGRSWFDTAPAPLRAQLEAGAQQGLLPAWDAWWPPGALERLIPDEDARLAVLRELEPLPLAYFQEVAPALELTGPAAYLRLSGAYEGEARAAGRLGWPVIQLPLHHLAAVTHAEAVAGAVAALAGQLAG
ncbi:MAG: hypothetical protein ACK4YQ_19315 [Phenylobacterium sp.]|uniref:hypothetical protein n=1 Tax=Phenylobacterium sp. TaxID=1871053 RepID=UPI00391A6B6F